VNTPPRWPGTLRSLTPPVAAAVALALLGLLVARAVLSPAMLRANHDVAGSYLQTLGTIYAVLLAFVVFVVWTQFNEARELIEKEASDLVDFARTARGLCEPTRSELLGLTRRYVDQVLDREWQAMARGSDQNNVIDEVGTLIDRMSEALHRCMPVDACQAALFSEALGRFNDLNDARTNRIANSRQRIPLALRLLLGTGAAMVVGSMYLFAVDSLLLHAAMTATLAGAIAHILYLVSDLDNCFAGDWQVPRAPFERVRSWLAQPAGVPGSELRAQPAQPHSGRLDSADTGP
jgi:hypothetical protein